MGISQSIFAMESGPERDERMEEVPAPEAERNAEEPTGLVPSAGTVELQQEGETGVPAVPASKRHTEVLELPPVHRGSAPATPAIRPGHGESSTPAAGKSKAERKQEKKTARKEEKTARKEEKRNRRAKQAEQAEEKEEKPERTPSRTPARRKLDAAMESAGTIESVLLLEKEYKAMARDPSHKPNFYFIIDRLISNLRYIPRTVYGPRQGKKRGSSLWNFGEGKKPRKPKLPSTQKKKWMKFPPQGNGRSKSWKRRSVPWRKRMIESERSSRMNPEDLKLSRKLNVEPENNVHEIPKQQCKYQLPASRRSRKPGSNGKLQNSWRITSRRVARSRRSRRKLQKFTAEHARIPGRPRRTSSLHFRKPRRRLKHSRSVWEEPWRLPCFSAEKRSVLSSMLRLKRSVRAQKYRELKPDLRSLLSCKKEFERKRPSRKDRVHLGRRKNLKYPRQPDQHSFFGVRAKKQPAEEDPGKEWRERTSSDVWKVGRQLKEGENFLECKYPPFTKEWQDGLREELLSLANRGFSKPTRDGELYPTKKFGWQLTSIREFESINQSLEQNYGVRLAWKSQEVKGKSKCVDDFHCFPIGKGKMEKTTKFGVQYTVLGTLPPNKSMCSICWSEGHWKSGCPFRDMVVELWEPALVVLVPAEKLRKYYPCRKIVCERYQDNKDNNFQYFYPAVALVDYGAVNLRISEINSKRYGEEKARKPEEYPEIEPPEDEREELPPLSTEQAMEYAASKKAAKPSDPEQRMASHSEALLEMQNQAKKRRAKQLEKESKKQAIDVDEESKEGSASKRARGGKGQGDETTKESLPPGHWQDRPRSISSPKDLGSQETKDALRQRLEAHKQEQLEEYHRKKLQKTIATHFEKESSKTEEVAAKEGPGEDEAASDPPSSSESSESSEATDDQEEGKNLS